MSASQFDLSILNIRLIGSGPNSGKRKYLWACAILCCFVVAIMHSIALFMRYAAYPTRIQANVVINGSMEFPAFTVCPRDRFDLVKLDSLWREHFGHLDTPGPVEQFNMLADIMDSYQLWSLISYISEKPIIKRCYLGRGEYCYRVGHFTSTWTPAGSCFTYSGHVRRIAGHFYGLYVEFAHPRQVAGNYSSSVWKVSIHGANVSPVLTVLRHYTDIVTSDLSTDKDGKSMYVNMKLVVKEFGRVDHPRKPCKGDDGDFNICEIECLEKTVASLARCKLPYMKNSGVPYCNTSLAVSLAEQLVQNLSTSGLSCNCLNPCQRIVTNWHLDSSTYKGNAKMRIYYESTVWHTLEEVYMFTPQKLLCDVGSVLALLLGASLLNIIELLELALCKVAIAVQKRFTRLSA